MIKNPGEAAKKKKTAEKDQMLKIVTMLLVLLLASLSVGHTSFSKTLESASFIEDEIINKNRLILANAECSPAPNIANITATGDKNKTGIEVTIKGVNLLCENLYLEVIATISKAMNADSITKQYKLSVVARSQEETQVSAFIKADEVVKRGQDLFVGVVILQDDGNFTEAAGSTSVRVKGFEAEKVDDKGPAATGIGKLAKTLLTVAQVILIVMLVLFVVIAVISFACICYRRKKSENRK
ncbi:MAG: hypothetical protein EZS28_014622 [Streblomastix strix]|uniref:Uncharacterized protein n=1 Tax=Streblomastix strix TaxID=222440 RepID=A0A5J4W4H8_9EUKA|nr:MAG: hypothetical protein EZS28_014622 [Streblomastix strix]